MIFFEFHSILIPPPQTQITNYLDCDMPGVTCLWCLRSQPLVWGCRGRTPCRTAGGRLPEKRPPSPPAGPTWYGPKPDSTLICNSIANSHHKQLALKRRSVLCKVTHLCWRSSVAAKQGRSRIVCSNSMAVSGATSDGSSSTNSAINPELFQAKNWRAKFTNI